MNIRMIVAASLLALISVPALAQDPTTFTCGDWVAADESTKLSYLNNTVAYANDAKNAANTAELQATLIPLSADDAKAKIDMGCDGKPVDLVILDLLKMN